MNRQVRSAVSVTRIKKHHSNSNKHQLNDGTASRIVRVTRIKSHSQKSFKTDKQSLPAHDQTNISVINTNTDSTNVYENMKNLSSTPAEQNNIDPHHSNKTNENLFSAINVNTTPFISITEDKSRNITPPRSNISTNFSSKVAPSSNDHLSQSSASSNTNLMLSKKQSINKLKSFRLSFGDRRQLYTIGKEDMTKKRCCKFCASCSPLKIFLLILLISLLVAAITAIPATIVTMQKTTTTIAVAMNSTLANNVTTTTTVSTDPTTTTTVSTNPTTTTTTVSTNPATATTTTVSTDPTTTTTVSTNPTTTSESTTG
ncbi:hypothetical protein I4U23_001327 [Adineta vaga]|nr:hypothetical protein I4U23_001327 [Adineta vaga]